MSTPLMGAIFLAVTGWCSGVVAEVRGPTPLPRWVTETNLAEARRWSLDPQLRSSDATVQDFENAVNNAAAAAELSWTQIV